jgi:hypothetical protein
VGHRPWTPAHTSGNVLIQVHSRLSRGSSLVICGPTPAVVSVLVAGGVMDIVKVCDNLIV